MAETVDFGGTTPQPSPGSAGAPTQVPGQATTVSGAAEATGGVDGGNFIQPDIDEELFKFRKDDTPLMNLMLKAKVVNVESAEVDHYMIDEERTEVTTTSEVAATQTFQAVLPLASEDQNIPRPYGTLLLPDVNGYSEDGQTVTPGKPLMLFVSGQDTATGNPVVRALNGPKTTKADEFCKVPQIPAGTKCIILSNALYETQKEVDPDLIVPHPTTVYLQKRGMNTIVSKYFESQAKRIPFSQALIAEAAITAFKTRGNRTLWASRKGKFKVNVPKLGMQYVYTTEGVRWQFKRELQHQGKWTFEQFIALAKMFFTGEDVPKTALCLAGKNLLEEIQCIDFSKHPEVQISVKTNKLGWEVTNIHTVFGDIEFKREPTLDTLGWSNSGALIGEDRLVHYKRKTAETSFNEEIEGQEATRSGELVWDALALKGSCHIWIDGEGGSAVSEGATGYRMWDAATAPAGNELITGMVYYLLQDCPAINANAQNGQLWQYNGAEKGWSEYSGTVMAVQD